MMKIAIANSLQTSVIRKQVMYEPLPTPQAVMVDRCGNTLYDRRLLDAVAPFTTITPSHEMSSATGRWNVSPKLFSPRYMIKTVLQGFIIIGLDVIDPLVQEYILKPLGWGDRRNRC